MVETGRLRMMTLATEPWIVGDGRAVVELVWVGWSGRLRRNTAGIIEEREAERWMLAGRRMVEGG